MESLSLIAPYAVGVLPKHLESKFNVEESQAVQKLGSNMKSTMTPQTASNGFGTKEMTGGLSTNSIQGTRSNPRRIEVAHPSKELHLSSIPSSFQCSNPSRPARNAVGEVHTGSNTQVTSKLGLASVLFRSNSLKLERASDSRTEAATPEATLPGVAFSKPIHLRNPSNITEEMEHLFASESKSFSSSNNAVVVGRSFSSRFMAPEESCETGERNQTIKSVAEKFKKILSPEPPIISSLSGTDSLHSSEGISSIRYIKGVAVQPGRTRSLVERWENREKCNSSEALADMMSENDVLPPSVVSFVLFCKF